MRLGERTCAFASVGALPPGMGSDLDPDQESKAAAASPKCGSHLQGKFASKLECGDVDRAFAGAASALHFQGQPGGDEKDLTGNGGDSLMQPPRMIPKFPRHAIFRHDAETDFIGNENQLRPS